MPGLAKSEANQVQSFHSIVGRLAADGGELLCRLAVEHEKEVAHLHHEIARLQDTIARFTGSAPPEIRPYVGSQVDRPASDCLPMSGIERAQERKATKPGERSQSGSGKPDENALAKAFAFVDSIHDDRALMHAMEETLEAEDTSRALKVAAQIVDITQRNRDLAKNRGGRDVPARSPLGAVTCATPGPQPHHPPGPTGPPLTPPLQPAVPASSVANSLLSPNSERRRGAAAANVRSPPRSALHLDDKESPRLRNMNLSPPVKAPGHLPEHPELPDDDLPTASAPSGQPPQEEIAEVLDERLGVEPDPAALPTSPRADICYSPNSKTRVKDFESSTDKTSDNAVSSSLKSADKPSGEQEARCETGYSPIPSRETTTWQPPLEEKDLMDQMPELLGLPRTSIQVARDYIDVPAAHSTSLPAEPCATPNTQPVPTEDWRSLLQVHGAKWRPAGDDGVGIGMYLESPSTAPVDGSQAEPCLKAMEKSPTSM